MAIDLERMMNKIMSMAEASQKARGIDNFGSVEFKNRQEQARQDALNTARDAYILNRDKQRDISRLTEDKITADQYRTALKNQQDLAMADAKNRTALQVADIRAGGGSGVGGRGAVTPAKIADITADIYKSQQALPGQPKQSLADIRKDVERNFAQSQQVQRNPDGTIKPNSLQIGGVAEERTQPYKNVPTALTQNQWQQHADVKSPGMQYESTQPGMQGDEIARFKRADGSTFFANAGAVRNRLGDTLTPTPAPVTAPTQAMAQEPEKYTQSMAGPTAVKPHGILQRYTDAYNKFSNSPLGKGIGLQDVNSILQTAPTPTPETSLQRYTDAYNKFSNSPLGKGIGLQDVNSILQTAPTPTPGPSLPKVPSMPDTLAPEVQKPGFLDWWKEKSRRNMPAKRVKNSRPDTFWNIPESSTNPLFHNYKQ